MARLDWKCGGAFTADYETNEIHGALHGFQHSHGDQVDWYRYLEQPISGIHAIYDEGDGRGRLWAAPINLPVLHVVRLEGRQEDRPEGGYYSDNIHVTASFNQVTRTGLTRLDIRHHRYLKDRIVYDDRVFRVLSIAVLGQVQTRDIIVSVDAAMVKPDELVNDQQFAAWAQRGTEPLGG
ncbi:hypothetical protein [Actinomadura atramentaria]|uniref:hypothetical protein n=1 Tax=Actinomadura atramentaria TaxID=1990 RepID=UPI000381D26F|nr:hypothetical protein [Actinomadura atramentaria]